MCEEQNNSGIDERQEMTNEEWNTYLADVFKRAGIPFEPTCRVAQGISLDYCYGVRIKFSPYLSYRKFRVILYDLNNHIKMFDEILNAGDYFVSRRKYFIEYGIQITDADTGEKICQHIYCAKDKPVVIDMPVQTIGDSIAWFASCEQFRKKHGCKLYVKMPDHTRKLFEKEYPEITFIDEKQKRDISPYAHYAIGVFHKGDNETDCPVDYRRCSLNHYSAYMLGVNPHDCDEPPRITIPDKRTIQEPYVCISSLASGMCKMWLNADGWEKVVAFLKKSGYRVIDIDLALKQGNGILWNNIPRDAEDFTGNNPLEQRAELIAHADFFIGLGSGLSWLAWCCKLPIVLISGFSLPDSEFYTPYRVINMNVCHGCYSDVRYQFVNTEYDWCPKHKGTKRHFECSRGITAEHVIGKINTIPAFLKHIETLKHKDGEQKQ